jgi:hypothetical protein
MGGKEVTVRRDALKAPISKMATIVPISNALGLLKYALKKGPVMIPDMTLFSKNRSAMSANQLSRLRERN